MPADADAPRSRCTTPGSRSTSPRWPHRPRVVIEDAAHALGALTPDGPVGQLRRTATCACFSFHPVKPITTGEGGVVTTNDDDLAERAAPVPQPRHRAHAPSDGGWYYEVDRARATTTASPTSRPRSGSSQLAKLESVHRAPQRDRRPLPRAARPTGLQSGSRPRRPRASRHGYHLFPVRVDDRRRVFDELRAAGIGVQVHYVPVHHHPVSATDPILTVGLPVCDALYPRLLSLPVYPGLTDGEVDQIIEALSRATEPT